MTKLEHRKIAERNESACILVELKEKKESKSIEAENSRRRYEDEMSEQMNKLNVVKRNDGPRLLI